MRSPTCTAATSAGITARPSARARRATRCEPEPPRVARTNLLTTWLRPFASAPGRTAIQIVSVFLFVVGLLAGMHHARATGASEVLTHHGFAEELARALRERGVEARPLGTVRQLDLFG